MQPPFSPYVLVISRDFPPMGTPGSSIRLVKMIKFASRAGWHFTVITQHPDQPVGTEQNLCAFLLDELPKDLNILRIPNPPLGQIMRGSSLPWAWSAFQAGQKLLQKQHAHLIYACTPPFSNISVGQRLAHEFKIPFVVDMKDDWVGSSQFIRKDALRRWSESNAERKMLNDASRIQLATRFSFEVYTKRYPNLADRRIFSYHPNGLDLEEYKLAGNPHPSSSDSFTLMTAASGYRPGYRDLFLLLQSIKLFLETHPEVRTKLKVVFIGEGPSLEYTSFINEMGLSHSIEITGNLPRSEMVTRLRQADLFFLVQPRGNSTSISGTLYEYWATGHAPVILFSEPGASRDLVISHNFGRGFGFDQTGEAAEYITSVWQASRDGHPINISRDGVEEFDRKVLVQHMLADWERIIQPEGTLA